MSDENDTSPKKGGTNLFKPGVSGNPNGRPKGAKNKTTIMREAIEAKLVGKLNEDAEKIYKKCVHLAMGGDTTCIKILMERLIPVVKQTEQDTSSGSKGITINIAGMEVQKEKSIIDSKEVEDAEVLEDSPADDRD